MALQVYAHCGVGVILPPKVHSHKPTASQLKGIHTTKLEMFILPERPLIGRNVGSGAS